MQDRLIVAFVLLALASATGSAQSRVWTPDVLVAGGIAGQRDGDSDFGSPGWTSALGVEWLSGRPIGVRLEAQILQYPSDDVIIGMQADEAAERVNVLATFAVWHPAPALPLYVLFGGAIVDARLTTSVGGRRDQFVSGGGATGIGVRATRRIGVEAQYLQATRSLGRTRSLVAARLLLRF